MFIIFAADAELDCKFTAAQDWKQTQSWWGGIKSTHVPDKVQTEGR